MEIDCFDLSLCGSADEKKLYGFCGVVPKPKRKQMEEEEDAVERYKKKTRPSSPTHIMELFENFTFKNVESAKKEKEEEENDRVSEYGSERKESEYRSQDEDGMNTTESFAEIWEYTCSQLRFIFESVDTQQITASILSSQLQSQDLSDKTAFFRFYKQTFSHWCTGSSQRRGYLYCGTAIHIWSLLMRERCFFFDMWVAFLVKKHVMYISKDQWDLFFEFCTEFHFKGFNNYDFNACWPTLFDEFVQFYCHYFK